MPSKVGHLDIGDIMYVACDLFSKKGYANTTLEDIAEHIGVRKGAIYYHIPRKADLLALIMRTLIASEAVELRKISLLSEAADVKLRLVIRHHLNDILTNRNAVQVFFEEQHALPADLANELHALEQDINSVYQTLLEEAMQTGVVAITNPKIAAMHIQALCIWPYRWFHDQGTVSREQFIEDVIAFIFEGLSSHTQVEK